MSVFVVRHAKAGSRRKWQGPDDQRPLSEAGRRQAEALTSWLIDEGISRIVSSPYVRCRQTVEPLAARLRLPVDLSDELAEGAPLEEAVQLVEKVSAEQAVLCTHGDVLAGLVWHAERHGVTIGDDRLEKGGTWVLDFEVSAIVRARYVPPPT